jgi:hypothetical protein
MRPVSEFRQQIVTCRQSPLPGGDADCVSVRTCAAQMRVRLWPVTPIRLKSLRFADQYGGCRSASRLPPKGVTAGEDW